MARAGGRSCNAQSNLLRWRKGCTDLARKFVGCLLSLSSLLMKYFVHLISRFRYAFHSISHILPDLLTEFVEVIELRNLIRA
jgi:hypothetical protein